MPRHKNVVVGKCRTGEDAVIEYVLGQEFEFGSGFEEVSLAEFVNGKDGLAGEDRGGADGTAEAILPYRLAGRAIHADRDTSVGGQVEPAVMIQGGGNIGHVARELPHQVGIGHIAHAVARTQRIWLSRQVVEA